MGKESKIIIEPSILSGDFGALAEEAKKLEAAGADAIHIDIMDGMFVPTITFGPQALRAIRAAVPNMFLDVHLMIYRVEEHYLDFVEAGASRITFHLEACEKVEEMVQRIRQANIEVGLSISPETNVELMMKYLPIIDLALIMTVHPGAAGQSFMEECLEKVSRIRQFCNENNEKYKDDEESQLYYRPDEKTKMPFLIQVDGGVDQENAKKAAAAGANVMVSGSALYKAKEMKSAIEEMRLCNQ